jgi:hypothetical protein
MQTLATLIEQSEGKFMTVTFVKKDGTIRVLNGRLGVTKYLKGGKSTLDPNKYVTLYDVQSKDYRAVNRDTIISVSSGGLLSFSNKD